MKPHPEKPTPNLALEVGLADINAPPRKSISKRKAALFSFIVIAVALPPSLCLLEGLLRLKNSNMKNYEIEMWRYAKELKISSSDPKLGHEHRPSTKSILQSVELRLNELGMRGGPIGPKTPSRRRILFLGSSITLGWGVKEEETTPAVVQALFKSGGEDVEVLNAGIGNFNCARYVQLFLTRLQQLKPDDIVIHFFLRDAEKLDSGRSNWLLYHSELAATLWTSFQRMLKVGKQNGLEQHYAEVFRENSPGLKETLESLMDLSHYAREKNIRITLAMVPDIHNLTNYPFSYAHQTMADAAHALGFQYVDLYPELKGITPEEIWAMPGDPHPNAFGHRRMAAGIYRSLAYIPPAR